ncbi:unnamed protein product [Orchesella dallaii]|uniref:Gustatory receptor n=1 Tax=Orchesella dallaii TaxID=48710 RepID=A0ABP1S3N3_9HEXA
MWKPRVHIWLEIIINFLYVICVSPFKVKFNRAEGTYTVSSSFLHKVSDLKNNLKVGNNLILHFNLATYVPYSQVLPALTHAFGILYTLVLLYFSGSRLSLANPKCIFHSAVAYSRYIIYYALLLTFWTRRSHFESFFSATSDYVSSKLSPRERGNDSKDETKAKIVTWICCLFMIPSSIAIDVVHYTGGSGLSDYIYKSIDKGAGDVLSVFGSRNTSVPASSKVITDFEYGFTLFYDFIGIYVRTCNHAAVLFCTFAAVTMYQRAVTFVASVSNDRDQEKVIQSYVDFCKFGSNLNKMCGYVVFGTVACSPPFFVVYFIGTFTNWEYTGPRVIFYSSMYCFLYIIAAEAASKIGEFKEWIIEYGEGKNESQLFAMFVEVSQNPMGLRGLECFTVTYGLLSKMFAIVVTFTIILLQFETTPGSPQTSTPCM